MDDIKDFISNILSGNNIEAKETFAELISSRAMDALAERKQEIAQSLFQAEEKQKNNEKSMEEEVENLDEKAVSKQQQKFMGMVYAAKKGMKPASPEVAKAAASMTKKQAKDYAATKHEGLPTKVKQEGALHTAALAGLGGLAGGPVGAAIGAGLGHAASKKP
jgi:hypothetical protein